MAKPDRRTGSGVTEKRGGYEPGPKTVSQLAPPPKTPGAGSKPSGSPGTGSASSNDTGKKKQ